MSARLNMNEIRYFSWKGRTFNQISSIIKKNTASINGTKHSLFMSPPLKIYRREIVTTTSRNCKSRNSSSIDIINMPGGTIVNSNNGTTNGLINTLDINLTNNKYERPGTCQTDVKNCLSQVTNARRRVRSSGIIKKQFDLTKNNDTSYHTSTNQYLVSRNRTFQQNQYYYIRQGNSTAKPGDALSSQNIYSSNGITHCNKYFMNDTSFGYQWVDRKMYGVTIPQGSYNIDDINKIFQETMTTNKHYFIQKDTGSYVYLLNIGYNNMNKIELQSLQTSFGIFNSTNYSFPLDQYNNEILTWKKYLYLYDDATTAPITVYPVFVIFNNSFKTAIGFDSTINSINDIIKSPSDYTLDQFKPVTKGYYPSNIIKVVEDPLNVLNNDGESINQGYSGNVTLMSSYLPGLQISYVPIYYKPNNPQFAQQGAVSASSHTARERYNTITDNSAKYRNAYGLSVANALAYGVPENGYTWKDKIGYPNIATPVISKYTGEVKKCIS